jgi:tetratricopeptide (TPR) repeat protein
MDPGTQDGAPGTGAAGKYRAAARDSQGTQFGDGNVQINLFGDRTPTGPVVAGNVPREPPAFQPREDLMAQLRAHGPGVSVVRAVTGMRGVGKTQLAAAYARECIDAGWRLVAWINAENTASLLAGLEVAANGLGIDRPGAALEAIGAEVRNRVEADGDRCLIVYDNVTDPGTLSPYLPSAGRCQVVVTSTQASALALGRPTEVAVFSEAESLTFLAERTGLKDAEGASLLAAELGHLPLALAQAAAVIRARHLGYQVYVTRLRTYPTEKYLPPAKGDPYPRGVAESILLSIDTVTATDGTGLCADLLGVISLLSPDGAARDLLYLGEDAGVFGVGGETIDEALACLADASLLTFGGEDESNPTVTAHRLVMRVIRERAALGESLLALGPKASALLSSGLKALGEPWQHREAARDLVQHVMILAGHVAPVADTDDESLTRALLRSRGWALWCLNALEDSPTQAISLGQSLVADLTRTLGEAHLETLASRNNLAVAYRIAGRLDEATALNEGTLRDYARILGESHPDTLELRNNLAAAYWAAGRLDEAISLLERTLADRVLVLGEAHPSTLMSRNNLAAAYKEAGRLDEAISLHERTLADRVRLLGENHPSTLASRNNLATAYDDAGRLDEAIPLYERTLADRVRVLGEAHPGTLESRNNLAYAMRKAGRLQEAIPLFEQALAGFERTLGVGHPSTVVVRGNLAGAREEAAQEREGPARRIG